MLIRGQKIEVKITARNRNHYREIGYDVNVGDVIKICPDELTKGSHVKVKVKCDLCGKEYELQYKTYLKRLHPETGTVCRDCLYVLAKQTWMEKYGVDHPCKTEEIKNRQKETFLKKYGVSSPMKSEELKQRQRQSMLDKYGRPYPLQVEEIRNKACNSYYIKNTQKCSKQQLEIYKMICDMGLECELNYPYRGFSLDCMIKVDNVKIDVEYDGWFWHKNKQKDLYRDQIMYNGEYKVLRIKSGKLVPEKSLLEKSIDKLITSSNNYEEIILDDWKE